MRRMSVYRPAAFQARRGSPVAQQRYSTVMGENIVMEGAQYAGVHSYMVLGWLDSGLEKDTKKWSKGNGGSNGALYGFRFGVPGVAWPI